VKTFALLLPLSLLMASPTLGASQPSKEKIDAFIATLTASCKAADIRGIKALSCYDGMGPGLVDTSVAFWEDLLENSKVTGRSFKGVSWLRYP